MKPDIRLLSIGQRYILKANHNRVTGIVIDIPVVINRSKIHFESKSQQGSFPSNI